MEWQTYPFEISVNNIRSMKVLEASCNVLQLRERYSAIPYPSKEDKGSHQANLVCLLVLNVVKDGSVCHHLRDHRKLSDVRLDFDRNESKDIRVGCVHPNYAFLAEDLNSRPHVN